MRFYFIFFPFLFRCCCAVECMGERSPNDVCVGVHCLFIYLFIYFFGAQAHTLGTRSTQKRKLFRYNISWFVVRARFMVSVCVSTVLCMQRCDPLRNINGAKSTGERTICVWDEGSLRSMRRRNAVDHFQILNCSELLPTYEQTYATYRGTDWADNRTTQIHGVRIASLAFMRSTRAPMHNISKRVHTRPMNINFETLSCAMCWRI